MGQTEMKWQQGQSGSDATATLHDQGNMRDSNGGPGNFARRHLPTRQVDHLDPAIFGRQRIIHILQAFFAIADRNQPVSGDAELADEVIAHTAARRSDRS
ncbi:MAG: hypothetical protein R3D29_12305 [Nitratireductor sp.]